MKWLGIARVVPLSLLLTGCVWVDPVPRFPDVPLEQYELSDTPTLPEAISYSRGMRLRLADRIADHIAARNRIAVSQIALTTLAAIDAAIDPSDDALAAAGLLSVAGYASGSYFESDARLRVFAVGIDGINCALTAVSPMAGLDLGEIRRGLDALDSARPKVMRAEAILASLSGLSESQKKTRTEYRDKARQTLEAAKASQTGVEELVVVYNGVGLKLQTAVDNIYSETSKGALSTYKDLDDLKEILSEITTVVPDVSESSDVTTVEGLLSDSSTSPDSGVTGGVYQDRSGQSMNFEIVLGDLGEALGELENATHSLSSVVSRTEEQAPIEALKECKVEIEEAIPPLEIVAPLKPIAFELGTKASADIRFKGGVDDYHAAIPSSPDYLSVAHATRKSKTAKVSYSGAGSVSTHYLVVESGGKEVIVQVQVAGTNKDEGSDPDEPAPVKQKEEVKSVQAMLKSMGLYAAKVDGTCGDKTDSAVKKFLAIPGVTSVFDLSSDLTCADAQKVADALVESLFTKGIDPAKLTSEILQVFILETLWNETSDPREFVVDGVINSNDPEDFAGYTAKAIEAEIKELLKKRGI